MSTIRIVAWWIEGEPYAVLFAYQHKKGELRTCYPKPEMADFYPAVMIIYGM